MSVRPAASADAEEQPSTGPPRGGSRQRTPAGTPVREALEGAMTAIAAAGCQTPRLDAEVLLAHVLGVDRARLWSERGLQVAGETVRAFQTAVRRRAVAREPVAYIVGRRGFRRLELDVDRRALIPRPETELLVEVGLALPQGASVLDACTGCGAVALALADERPDLVVAGSDLSEQALALAGENSERLGLELRWLHSDLLADVPDEHDAVLCNPPYVAESERCALPPEILRHEPAQALFGGEDGLELIRRLLAELAGRARVRLAAIEVGADQAAAVLELASAAGFAEAGAERDLAGVRRVVVARR